MMSTIGYDLLLEYDTIKMGNHNRETIRGLLNLAGLDFCAFNKRY